MRTTVNPIARHPYRDGIELSVIGLGGIVLCGLEQKEANAIVARSVELGVNYFDVAPSYGRGEAEEKLGIALEPFRDMVFLACKTTCRDAKGAQREMEQSLKRLRTDHFDLYQFHAVHKQGEIDQILARDGAAEVFLKARKQGKTRFIGFSTHAQETAIDLIDRFKMDSVLFPVNFVCYARANFGPRLLQHAKEKGLARLAIKSLAHRPWKQGETRLYPKCWYRPIDVRELARQAMRFALSEDITALVPPGDERVYQLALELAAEGLPALSETERCQLFASCESVEPLFQG